MGRKNSHSAGNTSTKLALPRFNSALGKFLALPAHLEQKYSDVVTQIYPLRASMTRLQEFCDGYLNLDEHSPIHFKPAAPWVLMQVVDYGKMASSSKNVGWFSQHELAFGVPLQCHKKENGKWVLADWAMVYPFIFVDSPLSMSGGREIYGWSKAGIQIDPTSPIFEPGNARRLVSISLVTSGSHFREGLDSDEFLQIFQRRPFLSATSAIADVFTAIPRAIAGSIAAAYSAFESTVFFPFGYADRDLQSLQEMLSRFYGQLNAFAPESFRASPQKGPSLERPHQRDGATPFNIVTMKQVRDVGSSPGACFQAIVGSKMQIERTTDAGYLFDPLSGDTSGGIYINLLNIAAQPIVQALGIQTNEYSSVGGKPASTLRPLAPFWLKMDLRYGLADYQYWRTHTTEWTLGAKPNNVAQRTIPYLGTGSGASEELSGPYHFPRITFRVLPLRAEKKKLQHLIDNYLKNDFFDFQVAGQTKDARYSIVCLVATNFEHMTAAADPDNDYSDCELTFAVPVSWRDKKNVGIKHPALVPIYAFTGTDWNAATSYEVYGRLALKSDLSSPDLRWLEDLTQPSRPNLLLTVKTELFPKLGQSQEAQQAKVLEIFSAPGSASQIPIAVHLKQLGLEHFWNGTRFHSIALKQILDAQNPELTNYQALIGLGRSFSGIKGYKPAASALAPLSINVYDYPTFPIVETLGLLTDRRDTSGLYPISTLTPIDPFWISGAMEGDAGHEMCWRVGTVWERNPAFDKTISLATKHKPTPTKRKKK